MKIPLSAALNAYRYRQESKELRAMIATLFDDPTPDWAQPVAGHPNCYEFYASGTWVQFEVIRAGKEMVIRVALGEELY